jgi:hypothetical protein
LGIRGDNRGKKAENILRAASAFVNAALCTMIE